MGMLINGVWSSDSDNSKSTSGEYKRQDSSIRNWLGKGDFHAEANRYHLYVSLACPWAHRAIIFRKIKGLENLISLSVVCPDMLENGWTFAKEHGGTGDPLHHFDFAHQVYTAHDNSYTGKVTVPILWDKQKNCIVNNESAEIIRMFNCAFNDITNNHEDYYPEEMRADIDEINDFVYANINNGVYKCGFATSQEAYDEAYQSLFTALDTINTRLEGNQFLLGDKLTEADWRLFTTLIRFDSVYFGHFKCNRKQIENYPELNKYVRRLYQWPGVAETVDLAHIKRHYYFSHKKINPSQIVPNGPVIDYSC